MNTESRSRLLGVLSVGLMMLMGSVSHAALIGVVDSGNDVLHPDFNGKIWQNPGESSDNKDNDGNGLVDDLNGWNFAENNNQLLDRSYLGKFSPDVNKFFEVQGRMMRGEASQEDKDWIDQKRKDSKFLEELQTFGNFMHGTHVAGITAKDELKAQVLGVKLIPTKANPLFKRAIAEGRMILGLQAGTAGFEDILVQMGLSQLAKQQGKLLAGIGKYLNEKKAKVSNCSFGTSHANAKIVVEKLLSGLGMKPTPEKLDEYATFFVNEVSKEMGTAFIGAAKATLFVIAAGNDGADNDQLPAAPANVKADNTITVAAGLDRVALAKFSNYGLKMVEVAAPGVTILSAIPGGDHMKVSGTSQAAPYVANVASAVFDANSKLTPAEVKKIIVGTVDYKAFLQGKVASGGMVNPARAKFAALASLTKSIDDSIQLARQNVADLEQDPALSVKDALSSQGYIVPVSTGKMFE